MKKSLLFSLSLLAVSTMGMFTSCTQDEIESEVSMSETQGQPIEFTLDVTSRGSDVVTTEDLPSIYVYGWYNDESGNPQKCFKTEDGTGIMEFKRQETTGSYKPKETIYWDSAWGDKATFYAFNIEVGTKATNESQQQITYMNLENANANELQFYLATNVHTRESQDLLTAKATVERSNARLGIPLHFEHILAAVQLQFKTSPDSKYKVETYFASISYKTSLSNYRYKFVADGKDVVTPFNTRSYDYGWFTSVAPELTSEGQPISDEGFAYIIPQKIITCTFNPFNRPDKNAGYIYYVIKVTDKKTNEVLYPTEYDCEVRGLTDKRKMIFNEMLPDGGPWDEVAYGSVGLGQDITFEAGKKYIITVDFTDGVGYYTYDDKIRPGEPILNSPLAANVTIEAWKDGEKVEVTPNKDDNTYEGE